VLLELSVVEQRYNAVMEVLRDGHMVIEVAERYGVSRQAVHRWLRRYQQGGLDALADRSHRPRRCPHQLAAVVEARLCELRRAHPGWGHGGWATSWPASRSPRCRRGPRSTGCWSATA
jgi:transposase